MWRCYEKLFGGVSVMNAESVKARLKNLAVKDGGTMQDKLITYALDLQIIGFKICRPFYS